MSMGSSILAAQLWVCSLTALAASASEVVVLHVRLEMDSWFDLLSNLMSERIASRQERCYGERGDIYALGEYADPYVSGTGGAIECSRALYMYVFIT